MYDRTFNFFNLNPQSTKRIILSSYLTLLTLNHLSNLVRGSPQATVDCERLLQHMYENDADGGQAILGAMLFGPVGLLMGGGGRDKKEIALELSRKGICAEYIEETYQFERKAREEHERARRMWEEEKKAHFEQVSQCKNSGGSDLICEHSALIREHSGVLILLGLAILLFIEIVIYDRINSNQRQNHPTH